MSKQRRRGNRKAQRITGASVGDSKVRSSSWIAHAFWVALFAAAVGALIWNQYANFFYSWADEQIHYYVAHRMVEGAVLYRDIDSARPPLVLLPLAWLMRLGFGPLMAGRSLVLVTQLATAGLLLWGGWRLASQRAGVVAALLFLISPEVVSRVHYTGIHLVALSTLACVLFFLRNQAFRAGLFFGLTLVADQHGLAVCGLVALLTMIRRPRDGIPFAAGAFLVSGIVFGGAWALGGRHLWASLVGLHLHHLRIGGGVGAEFWERFTPWIYEHGYLFAGAILAFALMGAKRRDAEKRAPPPSRQIVRVLLLVIGAHIAVVLMMAEAVFLYFVVIFPMLTLLAAMGYDAAVTWWRQGSQRSQLQARRASRFVLAGIVAVVTLTAAGWAAARSHREALDERHYSFWPHVLHGQVSRHHDLNFAVRGISDSMLPTEGTIFGDPTIVSVLALKSGLRVSGELADLNANWIAAGTVKREDLISRIEKDSVAAVISPPFGLVNDPYFKSYLLTCYDKPKPFFPPDIGPGSGLPFFMVFTHSLAPCQVPSP